MVDYEKEEPNLELQESAIKQVRFQEDDAAPKVEEIIVSKAE